jgi:hypothetical protein
MKISIHYAASLFRVEVSGMRMWQPYIGRVTGMVVTLTNGRGEGDEKSPDQASCSSAQEIMRKNSPYWAHGRST